ncbi:MAG: AAA family ATPase [Bacteriovoracaceae bacterium]|nr:AAA family ATPase [Bacteriovoracaceae bacterium]
MIKIPSKPIEIFCGTGGVGKTTLATSRALYLTSQGLKVLVITIDPAKRLKEILNLDEENAGVIQTIDASVFNKDVSYKFDALLMSPQTTLNRVGIKHDLINDFNNPILKILARPHGGMNEIMSVLELQYHLQSKVYDTIVLDTPPGKHFIDFLIATKKINAFFDKSYLDIFKYLNKPISAATPEQAKKSKKVVSLIIKSGIKKLLSYLEHVTGASFVDNFINAVVSVYKSKDSFLSSLSFQKNLKQQTFSNWFLVTSADQQKIDEALSIHDQAQSFFHKDSYILINKCISTHLNDWHPKASSPDYQLKKSMLQTELNLLKYAKKHFSNCISFNEVLAWHSVHQVQKLSEQWSKTPHL